MLSSTKTGRAPSGTPRISRIQHRRNIMRQLEALLVELDKAEELVAAAHVQHALDLVIENAQRCRYRK